MKPLPSSLDLPVEGSGRITGVNSSPFSKDHILVSYNWNEVSSELSAELTITEYPPHVRNLLTQTVTHEEIRIYSGARVECDNSLRHHYQGSGAEPLRLVIKSSKRPNIERAITWIRRLLDQAMNLPKFKEKVLIGLENASPGFDVRGKVLGPGGANLQYITNETGAIVTLRGRCSGFIEPTTGLESIEPLHLCVEHNSKYEVLQAGRQLAFNLIETVQQEWYSYQQQQQQQQQQPVQHVPPAPPPHSHHGSVVCSTANTSQLVSVPPPSTAVPPPASAVPPLLTTSVPPPLIHQPPPPPQPTHMQLSASLNQLVQGPPPQIPSQLNQPPPVHQLVTQGHPGQLLTQGQQANLVTQSHAQAGQQGTQLVSTGQQGNQLMQQSHQQLMPGHHVIQASQIVQSSQSHLVEQSQTSNQPNISLVHQGQPTSLLQAQQALSQAMVLPGSGGGVQVVQASGSGGPTGVQVLQTGQLSATLQPQQTLQEIPHVYSTAAGGAGGPGANVLTQQVLAPQASIIAQQPHIISQASYPLQYIQSAGGGGGMAVMYGAAPGGNNATRDGVMLVQYSGGAATRSRLQPQIVQLVHPGTGQVVGAAPLLLQAPHSPLLLQQHASAVPPGLLLQQHAAAAQAPSSLLLSQHQLQFAQPQQVQLVSQPPPQMMTVNSSSQQGVVTSTVVAVSSPQLSHPRTVQAQKRRFDDTNIVSSPGMISVCEVSSPHHNKKGVGDEVSPSKMSRDQVQQPTSQQNNNKLMISTTQSDEPDQQSSQRVEMKSDIAKRGRPGHGDNENDKESKVVYSYSSGKMLAGNSYQEQALLQQSLAQHVMPHQLQAESLQQALATHQAQGLPPSTIGVSAAQGVMPPPHFTSPPPNYPPQYYQQPYQTYQPSWNHMHNSGQ